MTYHAGHMLHQTCQPSACHFFSNACAVSSAKQISPTRASRGIAPTLFNIEVKMSITLSSAFGQKGKFMVDKIKHL